MNNGLKVGISSDAASELCSTLFGVNGECRSLVGYDDLNFAVAVAGVDTFILKCSFDASKVQAWNNESEVINALADADLNGSFGIPRILESATHQLVGQHVVDGKPVICRLLTFLPGVVVSKYACRPHKLMSRLGAASGALNASLRELDAAPFDRPITWDLQQLDAQLQFVDAIPDSLDQNLVRSTIENFISIREQYEEELPRCLIHNDLNDGNLLVSDDLISIIDYEDLVYSFAVVEPAVALAYLLGRQDDPLKSAEHYLQSYNAHSPLTETEIDVLFDFVLARLALNVVMAAKRRTEGKTEPYFYISEEPSWTLLRHLTTQGREYSTAVFRHAVGLPVTRGHQHVVEYLKHVSPFSVPISVASDERFFPVDFSVSSTMFVSTGSIGDPIVDPIEDQIQIDRILADNNATCAVGRYLEPRMCYSGAQYREANRGSRTIHLGIDVFKPAGTAVLAALDGLVHSTLSTDSPLDYGNVVILEHRTHDAIPFYSLYGHLSDDSSEHLVLGRAVRTGEVIGTLGNADENGGWVPHLHFQLMTTLLGHVGSFPGVANPNHLSIWSEICPNPNMLLKIGESIAASPNEKQSLLKRREQLLPQNLSLAYEDPLHIVRGRGQYLYDAAGREFLDCVNNVCHVGHCNPRVVHAAEKQMRILNTNTRYLHENILGYATDLLSTFPDELDTCIFVNSGSEANDLALRMARSYAGGQNIVTLDAAYHGNLSGLIDISPYKFAGAGGAGRKEHVYVADLPDTYRAGIDPARAAQHFVASVSVRIQQAQKDGGVSAFIAESLSGCGGQVEFPDGYLKMAYESARAAGAVCIADEVQVGFGRVGDAFWGFELQDVVPDIVTLGKPIANGHPMGAVVTTRAIADAFANGMEYFNTFGGNPVSCAIGAEVLRIIQDEHLQEHARQMGASLKAGLIELQKKYDILGDIRGRGLFLGIELVRDRESLEPAAAEASYIVNRLKNRRVLLSTDGPLHNVIKIKPPMVIQSGDVEMLLTELESILTELPIPVK